MNFLRILREGERVGIHNTGDFGRFKHLNKLDIPDVYEPRATYQSPEEIALALGLDPHEVDKLLVLLPPTEELPRFRYLYGDYDNSMSNSMFVVTPASLFTLLQLLTNIPDGYRFAYVDGSRNFTIEKNSTFIIIGSHDVSYRDHTYTMSQAFRPISYALVPGERIKVFGCQLDLLKLFSQKLFRLEFRLDFGGMDHSDAFAGGFRMAFGEEFPMLLCWFHANQLIVDKHNDKPWGKIVGTKEERDAFHEGAKTAMQCLHLCKTGKQRKAGLDLFIQYCREQGQDAYADHIRCTFGKAPWWNFNYAASGKHAVIPQGSSTENFNKGSKKTAKLNVTRETFCTVELPKVLKSDAQKRCGLKFEQFEGLTKTDEAIAILMTDDDVIKAEINGNEVYLVNPPPKVGRRHRDARLNRHTAAILGNSEHFRESPDDCPLTILKRMVGASQTFCVVTKNEPLGIYVGDCKSCYMHLSCPCVAKVRDMKGLLQPKLAETITPFVRKTRGHPQKKGLGGRGGIKKQEDVCEPPSIRGYYLKLTISQLEKIADKMRVVANDAEGATKCTEKERRESLIASILDHVEKNKKRHDGSINRQETEKVSEKENANNI